MPAELLVPKGELETLAMIKEVSFGVLPGAPSIFHPFANWNGDMTNNSTPRMPRGSLVAPFPATGGRSGAASLDVETTVDTFGQWLKASLGTQSAPTHTIINTTLNGATIVGATSFVLGASAMAAPNLFPGMPLAFDSAGQAETLTIATVNGNTVTTTTAATKTHANGVAVVCTATTAYASTFKIGALDTWSIEVNRPGSIATDYLGCKVDTLGLSLSPKGGLQAKLGLCFKRRVNNGSPTAATHSTKYPPQFEQQFAPPIFNTSVLSSGSEASVLGLSINLNNNLLKDYFALGAGNEVRGFPEQLRKVTGSLSLGFESQTVYNAVEGAINGGALPSASLLVPVAGQDAIETGIPYAMSFYLPSMFLQKGAIADKTSGNLTLSVPFEAFESSMGASDALTAYLIAAASAIY